MISRDQQINAGEIFNHVLSAIEGVQSELDLTLKPQKWGNCLTGWIQFFNVDKEGQCINISDSTFVSLAELLEPLGVFCLRQNLENNGHTCLLATISCPLSLDIGYHATSKSSWESIRHLGLKLGSRENSNNKVAERIDQIGNIYLCKNLGFIGDRLTDKTAFGWLGEFSDRARRDGHTEEWCVLEVRLSGIDNLRLFANDFYSSSGLILRTEISPSRIARVA